MNTRALKLLKDICDAAARISRFVRGKTREDYLKDELLRSAVERQLLIVGEATSRLVQEDRVVAEALGPVKSVVAFRNILVHAYFQIKDEVVWDVVERDVPALAEKARELLAS